MRLKFKHAGKIHEIDVQRQNDKSTVSFEDKTLEITVSKLPNNGYLLVREGRIARGYGVRRKDNVYIQIDGRCWTFQDITSDEIADADSVNEGDNEIVAPMPGSVIKLLVEEGQRVKRKQPLVIVEAMKMENEVHAPIDGIIGKILVDPGQQVGFGEKLIELVPMDGAEEPS